MTDEAIASFMARAVATDRRGTERLAQALEALAPDHDRKRRSRRPGERGGATGRAGREHGFEPMWESVANAVMSYTLVSNLTNVSEEYGKEISSARRKAIEVERVSDDPPERVQAWVATVTESALAQLDLEMLLDLLRIEGDARAVGTGLGDRGRRDRAPYADRRRRRRACAARSVGARDDHRWSAGTAHRRDEGRRSSGGGADCPTRRLALPQGID